jgi:outer membrane protein
MNNYLISASLLLAGVSLGVSLWFYQATPSVAYVRSAVLIDEYHGMKEARTIYEKKATEWQTNIDSLTLALNRTTYSYNIEYTTLNAADRELRKQTIEHQQRTLATYREAIEEKAEQEEEKLMQGALNQINSFVAAYAKHHGYTLVLGTTQSGNILYADQATDITQAVLKELNQSYYTSAK